MFVSYVSQHIKLLSQITSERFVSFEFRATLDTPLHWWHWTKSSVAERLRGLGVAFGPLYWHILATHGISNLLLFTEAIVYDLVVLPA